VPTSTKKTAKSRVKLNNPKRGKGPGLTKRRKNLILDQGKIDRAKSNYGVATETEAVDRALDVANDLAEFRRQLESGLSDLIGKGGFTDRFPPSSAAEAG